MESTPFAQIAIVDEHSFDERRFSLTSEFIVGITPFESQLTHNCVELQLNRSLYEPGDSVYTGDYSEELQISFNNSTV